MRGLQAKGKGQVSERCSSCGVLTIGLNFLAAFATALATFIVTVFICVQAWTAGLREDHDKCAREIRAKESEKVLLLACAPKASEPAK